MVSPIRPYAADPWRRVTEAIHVYSAADSTEEFQRAQWRLKKAILDWARGKLSNSA